MSLVASQRAGAVSGAVARPWTAKRKAPEPGNGTLPTRRYDVAWLDDRGQTGSFGRIAPCLPLFEAAFSAFARGTLVHTTEGMIAVEDLVPGMMVETATGPARLAWIGAITAIPSNGSGRLPPQKLYRVTADAFGLDRPLSDLMLGPSARVVSRGADVQLSAGAEAALVAIRRMADGQAVIELSPVSPVRVFHLGFHGHRILRANGVEAESFHPGQVSPGRLGPEMSALFMSLFPHVRDMSGFGRLTMPRLPDED